VLARIDADKLVDKARDNGAYLAERLRSVAEAHPHTIEGSRGLGLLQALVLRPGVDARTLLESLRAAGVLLTVAGGTALRFSPALNIERSEIDEAIGIVDRVLATIERESAA
jgi:acetylornithine/succinyldiaminopimelate/putrescine aminotransferase